jgi:hypothetical protein
MTIPSYERNDTIRLTYICKSGSVAVYPLSANLNVYKPNGTVLYQSVSGHKTGTTGEFYYYISTNSTSDLGIYTYRWHGKVNYGPWGYLPDDDMDSFILTTIA